MKKQRLALQAFWKLTWANSLQVLILFNVGVVRLNLTCANIMIMVVCDSACM